MIAMRFYSNLFHGIGDSIRFLGIDYTPSIQGEESKHLGEKLYQMLHCFAISMLYFLF